MAIYFKPSKEVDALLKTVRTYFDMVEKKEIVLKRREYETLLKAIPENQRRHFLREMPFEGGVIKSA